MSIGTQTPRDQFDRLVALLRRVTRYTWLVVVVAVVGAALSVAFALTRQHQYQSQTVLLYRELISESILQGRDVVESSRSITIRYREMVEARSVLEKIINQYKLFPDIREDEGMQGAIEEMRKRIGFRARGAGTFEISYKGNTPKEAQKVTAALAKLLIDEDNHIRRQQATVTNQFLEEEKSRAEQVLKERERSLAKFLAKHPEFAEDTQAGKNTPGASIRAAQKKGARRRRSSDPRLNALERQRDRLQARLEAPDQIKPQKNPALLRAQSEEREAQQEVAGAQRRLQDKLARFTERHPDVVAAKQELLAARKRLQQAKDQVANAREVAIPTGPIDRNKLEQELHKVQHEITRYRAEKHHAAGSQKVDTGDNWVVALETRWAKTTRDVNEARERVNALDSKVFAASIQASSQLASASQLTVIDKAYRPIKPAGRSKRLLAMVGAVLFGGLAVALAFGLALIDDRIYTRQDLEHLGVAPVLTVVPKRDKKQRRADRGNGDNKRRGQRAKPPKKP